MDVDADPYPSIHFYDDPDPDSDPIPSFTSLVNPIKNCIYTAVLSLHCYQVSVMVVFFAVF